MVLTHPKGERGRGKKKKRRRVFLGKTGWGAEKQNGTGGAKER
jgi:hypothetical protein